MARQVRFDELELQNFTSHRSLNLSYGDITKLTGMNGQGKTSIGTAPIWIMFGTDLFGKKFDPSPTTYEFDRVFASLILSVDGKQLKFAREIEKGKNKFYINDVPAKAKEFDDAIADLFDKDEFMSLYNPSYFFTLHWTKQREQVLKYVSPPAKQEVLKALPELQSKKLDELTKKYSLDDLQKLYRDQKIKLEKQHIAAESRTKTLQEQLNRLEVPEIDMETAVKEAELLKEQIREADAPIATAYEKIRLQDEINRMLIERNKRKEQFKKLNDEPIEDICRTCKQPLQEEAVKAVEADKQKRIAEFIAEYDELNLKRKNLEEKLAELEIIDVEEQREKVRELENQLDVVNEALRTHKQREQLQIDIEKAKQSETDTLKNLKESIFILDAIKDYRAKEAELQADKVQSLFTKLSIRLFKYIKTTGEYEPDFSVQMDGKDYVSLSFGEKIEAGLELSEVLFKQSELITPVFVDGVGEYTGPIAVFGQVITATAVKDQELKIETEDAA